MELYLVVVGERTFVGRKIDDTVTVLSLVVEMKHYFVTDRAGQGQGAIIGQLIGEMKVPSDGMIFKLAKESPYWKIYFGATSGLTTG